MLMESLDGESRTIEIGSNTACYVPRYWIHRSMNLGDEDFVMLFCYPADSGQDYEIIERFCGMHLRIVDDGAGGWRGVPNTSYIERSGQEADALLQKRRKRKSRRAFREPRIPIRSRLRRTTLSGTKSRTRSFRDRSLSG